LPLARHAHSHFHALTCFEFLIAEFQRRERLLAVYPMPPSFSPFAVYEATNGTTRTTRTA